jgi:hypothetical protein
MMARYSARLRSSNREKEERGIIILPLSFFEKMYDLPALAAVPPFYGK